MGLFLYFPLSGLADENIIVSSTTPKQGQTIEVNIVQEPLLNSKLTYLPIIEFNGRQLQTFPAINSKATSNNKHFHTLLAIPATLKPGLYTIKSKDLLKEIQVVSAQFPVQKIRLPKGKDTFAASAGEKAACEAAKAALSDKRMWDKQFQRPTNARVSTVFGVQRIVNGHFLSDYFHTGVDFAAPAGSYVKACAPGKIILIGNNWKLHGNTIAIDHGQGVISFYIHLQKILAHKGQMVRQGQIIGLVGQSGRANGPHLHFSLYVNQVATNPIIWFNQVF